MVELVGCKTARHSETARPPGQPHRARLARPRAKSGPIYAVMERAQEATAALSRASNEVSELDAACEAESKAVAEMVTTVPTTLAGAAALLRLD